MKFLNLIFAGLIPLILSTGCTSGTNVSDSEAGNPEVIAASANALITLPSSMTGHATLARAAAGVDPALGIYDFIREQAYFVNGLVITDSLSAANIIQSFSENLPWKTIVDQGSWQYDSAGVIIDASYSSQDTLPYRARYENFQGSIAAAFNGSTSNPAGWVRYASSLNDSLTILVRFAKSASSRRVHVEITKTVTGIDTTEGRSFIYDMRQDNDIIHLSACSYHPRLKLTNDTVGRCYEYTAVINNIDNRAVVNLGIPTGDLSDTSIVFTQFGIDEVYGNEFIRKDLAAAGDTVKGLVVTSEKTGMRLDTLYAYFVLDSGVRASVLASASAIGTFTTTQLRHFCEINRDLRSATGSADYAALLWILKLSQPVYFSENGYAGNGTNIPSEFTLLAATPCALPVQVPSAVRSWSITETP